MGLKENLQAAVLAAAPRRYTTWIELDPAGFGFRIRSASKGKTATYILSWDEVEHAPSPDVFQCAMDHVERILDRSETT
jgi:hypothetical protein